ncbi:MAG: porin family protein [Bacteroidales bacterium]|nr:porin family protein [Bacteroidales bacterium]
MRKYIFLIVTVCLFGGHKSYSQENKSKPGFIINNSLDTVHGEIKLNTLKNPNKVCTFITENGKVENYHPEDIVGYQYIDGKGYSSKEVVLDQKKSKLFLEYLVDGKADLFYISLNGLEHYFIQNDSDTILELKNTEKQIRKGDGTYIVEAKEYTGCLKIVMQDSPEIYGNIENSSFNFNSLVKVTKKYHKLVCEEDNCIDYTKNTKVKFAYGIRVGYLQSYKFCDYDIVMDYFQTEKPVCSNSLSYGAYAELGNVFGFGDFSKLIIGIDYYKTSIETAHASENMFFTLDFSNVHIPFNYKYTYFNVNWMSAHINAGFAINVVRGEEIKTESRSITDHLLQHMAWGQFGVNAGTGLELKMADKISFVIDYNYEINSGLYGGIHHGYFLNSRMGLSNLSCGLKFIP